MIKITQRLFFTYSFMTLAFFLGVIVAIANKSLIGLVLVISAIILVVWFFNSALDAQMKRLEMSAAIDAGWDAEVVAQKLGIPSSLSGRVEPFFAWFLKELMDAENHSIRVHKWEGNLQKA